MNTPFAVLAVVGGVALFIFACIGAVAVYDGMDDGGMMDGGMMDGGMMDGGMMDGGMMRGRGRTGPETSGSASGQGDVVISDFTYLPSTLTVTPGTVVTWTNEDRSPHAATAVSDDTFDTGRLDQDESAEVTFNAPGTFEYICTYHPYMEGRIVVSPASR